MSFSVLAFIFAFLAIFCTWVVVKLWKRMRLIQRIRSIVVILVLIAFVNNFLFNDLSMTYLGGRADIGKIEGNHYFVGNHGHYTEVPREEFVWNLRYGRVSETLLYGLLIALLGLLAHDGFFRRPGSEWSLLSIIIDPEIEKHLTGNRNVNTSK
jgi:energy-coupling factor transporter transmembrane protein EcfT